MRANLLRGATKTTTGEKWVIIKECNFFLNIPLITVSLTIQSIFLIMFCCKIPWKTQTVIELSKFSLSLFLTLKRKTSIFPFKDKRFFLIFYFAIFTSFCKQNIIHLRICSFNIFMIHKSIVIFPPMNRFWIIRYSLNSLLNSL